MHATHSSCGPSRSSRWLGSLPIVPLRHDETSCDTDGVPGCLRVADVSEERPVAENVRTDAVPTPYLPNPSSSAPSGIDPERYLERGDPLVRKDLCVGGAITTLSRGFGAAGRPDYASGRSVGAAGSACGMSRTDDSEALAGCPNG